MMTISKHIYRPKTGQEMNTMLKTIAMLRTDMSSEEFDAASEWADAIVDSDFQVVPSAFYEAMDDKNKKKLVKFLELRIEECGKLWTEANSVADVKAIERCADGLHALIEIVSPGWSARRAADEAAERMARRAADEAAWQDRLAGVVNPSPEQVKTEEEMWHSRPHHIDGGGSLSVYWGAWRPHGVVKVRFNGEVRAATLWRREKQTVDFGESRTAIEKAYVLV